MTVSQILGGGTAMLAVLALATLLLPRHVHVARAADLEADAAAILHLAGSGAGYQRFNPYLEADPDLSIQLFGPASGVGSGFRFDGRDGRGTQTVAAIDPHAVTYRIDLGAMGQPRQVIHAEARGDRAHVTWTMDADLGFNPIARVMGLFLDRMVGPTLERGLARLEDAA